MEVLYPALKSIHLAHSEKLSVGHFKRPGAGLPKLGEHQSLLEAFETHHLLPSHTQGIRMGPDTDRKHSPRFWYDQAFSTSALLIYWCQLILCCVGLSCSWRMVSSTPGLYPLPASDPCQTGLQTLPNKSQVRTTLWSFVDAVPCTP